MGKCTQRHRAIVLTLDDLLITVDYLHLGLLRYTPKHAVNNLAYERVRYRRTYEWANGCRLPCMVSPMVFHACSSGLNKPMLWLAVGSGHRTILSGAYLCNYRV